MPRALDLRQASASSSGLSVSSRARPAGGAATHKTPAARAALDSSGRRGQRPSVYASSGVRASARRCFGLPCQRRANGDGGADLLDRHRKGAGGS
jgi:hypothetical protein